jgi:biotin transport system substrate-specific component
MSVVDSRIGPDQSVRMMIYGALMAALIAVGAYIVIPIGPVPIVLQNLFVLLAGLLLGSRWAAICVTVYLIAGVCGLPVFSGGGGGLGKLFGPTGGYLVGFLPAAFFVGWISDHMAENVFFKVASMVGASLIIYGCGIFWLMHVTHLAVHKALAVGAYPFIIGDILKIAVAVPISSTIRPLIRR